ncbi:unnamed protein product [Pleuronectes platessa]|uniref:Uncharacterized protein n=1 Tax=Pleuronectes platessa TaxID=8262 RepID=A0A9N7W192_PLEPL|nr:unnamed protein product [Pleuronectes platessa]
MIRKSRSEGGRAEKHCCRLALHGQSFSNKGGQRRRRPVGGGGVHHRQRCPLSPDTCCWRAADIEDTQEEEGGRTGTDHREGFEGILHRSCPCSPL